MPTYLSFFFMILTSVSFISVQSDVSKRCKTLSAQCFHYKMSVWSFLEETTVGEATIEMIITLRHDFVKCCQGTDSNTGCRVTYPSYLDMLCIPKAEAKALPQNEAQASKQYSVGVVCEQINKLCHGEEPIHSPHYQPTDTGSFEAIFSICCAHRNAELKELFGGECDAKADPVGDPELIQCLSKESA